MGCGPPNHKVWLVTKQPLRFGPIRTKGKTATAYPHRSRRCGRQDQQRARRPRPPAPAATACPPPPPATSDDVSTTALGAWYATRLPWRRPTALLVDHTTLLPLLMPLAPAATLLTRVPEPITELLHHHAPADLITTEPSDDRDPVGFQKLATVPELRFQAVGSYWLIRPPRTG